ncbi:RagB/SusD family nutrient uptake outer membrane protein [Parapedobacter sp. 10938]|uniref:RagB/SusD family nutrient uptake outer membrane protein n=1 Tax=Parapedobacter flavus TaxID=3110225 RepID=UPI002DB9C632|nr:RagB/SusD family nutrient uptake outer membrane protein [Parapedobacter sp. 10938]MEC3880000.1 RagB/SusD family nutrient uptake outer membrane protein [Parapedobacter sp. 10938]
MEKFTAMQATILAISITAAVLLAGGCTKELELTPQSTYNTEDFYQTAGDFRQALFGAYGGLRSVHGFDYPMMMESLSDNVNTLQNTTNNPLARFGFTAGDDRIFGVWAAYWTIINRTNNILDQIDDGDFANELVRTIMRGETRFIRGYCYFQLGWIFGGMPIIDRRLSAEETATVPRASQEETFAFATADLLAAAEVLPGHQGGDNLGRVTKFAAKAILARLYLYTQHYESAKPLLEEILAYDGLQPYDAFGDCFVNTRDNGSEHVFQIQYTSGLNSQGNPLVYSLVPENLRSELFPQGGRSTWVAVSNDLYTAYDTSDIRRDFTIQKGYTSSNDVTDSLTLLYIKYAHGAAPPNKEDNDVNLSIVRITDVQLMYAEVLNELGYVADGEAFALLNVVRQRAGLDSLTSSAAPNQGAFREAVFRERRLEFAGEALRWYDIVRQGAEKATEIMNDFLERSEEGDGQISFEPHYLLMPIPASELRTNPTLTQNPGY